jgi:hypothetical protein
MTAQSFRVPLTLFTNVSNIIPYATWSDPLNPSDPWTGYPYQWQVSVDVQSQTHSDPETPIPYTYNGLSVSVGNWLIFTTASIAVEVISITSQTDSVLTFIVEDVGLSNIVNNPTQSGIGIGSASDPGVYDCLIINLNSEGIPVFATIPDYAVPINLIPDIVNRFQSYNYIQDFIPASQPDNIFQVGDIIYLNADGTYTASLSTLTRSTQSIGTVTSINQPDVGDFTYRPINRYVTNLPTLPGYPGDVLYVSSTVPGGVTNVVTVGNTIPVYIKITDNSAIFTSGSSSSSATIVAGEIAFGGPSGQLVGNVGLTFNTATQTLKIGNIEISSDYITTAAPGDNLILAANVANVQITTTLDMTDNRIINVADPQNGQDVATKSYVDAVASGLNVKASVIAATTADLNASFTPTVNFGSLTSNTYQQLEIDSYYPVVNNRILVKNQPNPTQNGIYVVIQTGSSSQSWVMSRSADFNGQGIAGKVETGDFVFVQYGTLNTGTGWVVTTPDPIAVNTSPIVWTQFSAAGVILPGFGLTQTGQLFNVNAAAFVDSATALKTISGPGGYGIIELQLDSTSPLIFRNNALSVSSTIAGTGLSYNISNGVISVNSSQPQITELGNITVGTWSASTVGYQYGGTGNTHIGTPGQVLGVNLSANGLTYLNHSQITESISPPTFPVPADGDRWYNSVSGVLFTYITDDTGNHWVQL